MFNKHIKGIQFHWSSDKKINHKYYTNSLNQLNLKTKSDKTWKGHQETGTLDC